MNRVNKVVSILREYMGFSCACDVADEIDELYNPKEVDVIYEIQQWKNDNCFDEDKNYCQVCCSGGMMLGAMCEEMLKKWKEEITEVHREKCIQFGNLDGMNGSCHYCKENNRELFQACWNEKFKDSKPKLPKNEARYNGVSNT